MNFAVIYSKKDEAGVNIIEKLKDYFLPQMQIIESNKDTINLENIDEKDERLRNVEFIIFATKHVSKAGDKTLCLHVPGNWRNADYGGKAGRICKASSLIQKYLFQKLEENHIQSKLENYKVTLECTHHGPLIEKPCCFIEVGGTEIEWNDKEAAEIIAKTINDFQNFETWKNQEENKKLKSAIGIGGPHYAPNFTKIQLTNKQIAIGHIIPEYALPLSDSIIMEIIAKTKERLTVAVIDWKGCGKSEDRQKIIDSLEKTGLEIIRTDQIDK